jgi:transposase
LAERHRDLGRQAAALTARIDPIVTAANPGLRAAIGVGPDVAAQLLITAGHNPDRLTSEPSFAALCGVAPVPAPSGKTRRYRLSRGGDRQASALHRIALSRMSHHRPTTAYVRDCFGLPGWPEVIPLRHWAGPGEEAVDLAADGPFTSNDFGPLQRRGHL